MATEPDRDDRPRGLLPTIHRRRRWLLAMAMLTSAAVVAVAYESFETSYEATAYLLFEPAEPPSLDRELETAAVLVTTPDILESALKDPAVAPLPRIKSAPDPHAFLRRRLRVAVVPKTRLVRVAMTLSSPQDAAKVVDAVAKSFRDWAIDQRKEGLDRRLRILQMNEVSMAQSVREKQDEIRRMIARGNPDAPADPDEVLLARQDLARLDDALTKARAALVQFRFDTINGRDPIRVIPARPGTRPEFDPRILALALGGMFLAVLFLFYLETFFHRGRPADGADAGSSSPLGPPGHGAMGCG
ncbi:MAG TPA: hypothetical protein VG406_04820 [Isosphaeraceae bacterium]|jgi:uncharacterized protein involved in exopolysaccharide biosynthesis|nr:hypothetical protein [Isosphaeraceae bacterium]